MARKLRFPVLLVLCASLFELSVAAQALLTLDRGPSYEMAREGGHWATRVYVTPKVQSATAIAVSIRGIAIGPRSDPGLNSAFAAVRRIPENGAISAVDVMTRDGAEISRGVYDVLLNVTAGPYESQQPLTIQVTIPAAALKQPASLVVSQVLPLFGAPHVVSAPLLVSETGRKSPASLLVVQQDAFSDSAGVYDGQLQFDPVTVQPGNTAKIPYAMRGMFPLGSSKASLSMTAPEIESAISIPVEVRTRRTRLLLLIMITLGLGLGFLMRTALKQRIQFGEARQKALEVSRKLEEERENVPDVDFRARIDRAVKTLLLAVKDSRLDNTPALTEATSTAEKSLSDAQADLQNRALETVDEFKALMVVVKTSWRLPKRILGELDNAARALAPAQELIKGQNPAGARRLLDSTRESLAATVSAYYSSFRENLPDLQYAFDHAVTLLPATQREAFSSAIAGMTASTGQIRNPMENDEPDTLKSVLTALDNALDSLRRMMGMLRLGTLETLRTIDQTLRTRRQDPSQEWKLAEKTTNDFIDWLRSAAEDPVDAGLADKVEELFSAWRLAFQNQDADEDTVAMAGRGELAAAAELLPRKKRESLQGDAVAPAEPGVIGVGDAMAMEAVSETSPPSEPALFESFYPGRRKQVTTEVLEANTLTQLIRARWLMTALSAIGLAIVGYLLFADKFVGTSGDLMTAFFWGFSSDIGLDALITAATAKKTTTP